MTLDVVTASAPLARSKHRRAGARPQRGVTLLELLIGVGVIIVVMVIVLMGMRNLNAQMDRSALLRQAPQIRANVAGFGKTGAVNLAEVTTARAHGLSAFPLGSVTVAGDAVTVKHELGGQIFVAGFNDDFGAAKKGEAFTLSYTGIPTSQCASVARGLALVADGIWVGEETAEIRHTKPADNKVVKVPGSAEPIGVGKLVDACKTESAVVTVHALMAN
ncbi:hypothetical protein ACFJIX_25115 [Roseateles sp. UC29_93]|uniref:hypothetical protein n=1 Tax=Roseateles sp. UC29_93 TaxID=3350177 RepID=UPI003671684B